MIKALRMMRLREATCRHCMVACAAAWAIAPCWRRPVRPPAHSLHARARGCAWLRATLANSGVQLWWLWPQARLQCEVYSANAAIAQLTALTILAVVLQGRHEQTGASTGALRSLSRMRRGNKLANAELHAGKQWPSPTSSAKTTPHRLSSGSDEAPLSGRISACEEMEAARPAGQSLPIAVGAGVAAHSPPPRGSPDATAADTQFPTLLATADESPFASPRGNALSESDSDSGKMPVARHIFRLFAPPGARPPADPPSPDLEVRAADDDSDDASKSRSPAWERESEWRRAAPSSCDESRLESSSSGESARKSARHSVDSNVSAGSREHSGPLSITTGGATLGASAHSSLVARSLTPSRAAVAAAPPPFAASRTQSLRGDVTTGAAARDAATARATYAATRSHSHCGVASGGADERRLSLLDAFGDIACRHEMLARALEHDSEVEDAAERASSLSEEMSSGELSWLQGAGSDDEAAWAAEPVRLQQLGSGEVAPIPSPDGVAHCCWRAARCCTRPVHESLFKSPCCFELVVGCIVNARLHNVLADVCSRSPSGILHALCASWQLKRQIAVQAGEARPCHLQPLQQVSRRARRGHVSSASRSTRRRCSSRSRLCRRKRPQTAHLRSLTRLSLP